MDLGKKALLHFLSWPLRLFPTSAYIIQSKKGKVLSKVENVHEIAKDFIKLLKKMDPGSHPLPDATSFELCWHCL